MPLTYSYSGTIDGSDVDFVRFATGDKLSRQWLLADEEIAGLVARHGGREAAVMPAFDACIAVASQSVSTTQGEVTQQWQQRFDNLVKARQLASLRFPEPAPSSDVVAQGVTTLVRSERLRGTVVDW